MPNGTIQDSRRPYSPQWGYLKLAKNENNFALDNYAFLENIKYSISYRGEGNKKPKWPPMFDDSWNKYIMFFHNLKCNKHTRQLPRGTNVKFEMRKAKIIIYNAQNIPVKKQNIWVAEAVQVS